ncbi:MAG: hypothetical protein J0I06_14580, partial [Planctomycetes bacterium]|nr:hypothetical protein [Planctomycetota bacterium]
EVAEFQRYKREKEAGTDRAPPPNYIEWELAGRPSGVPGAASVFRFDRELIQKCQEYDQNRTARRPGLYSVWVAAGRPAEPGLHPLTRTVETLP